MGGGSGSAVGRAGRLKVPIRAVPARPWQFTAEPVSSAYCGGRGGPDNGGNATW